jgi:bacterial/archaeal transporter family-2 protein
MGVDLLYALMAAAVGALIPLQTGANATIRSIAGQPAHAAIVNFGVGGICIILYALFSRLSLQPFAKLSAAPWWAFLGGAVGVTYVLIVSLVARKLGATPLLFLVLAGQLISSLVCDHFGLIGFPKSPVTMSKVIGISLVIVGVLLIRR